MSFLGRIRVDALRIFGCLLLGLMTVGAPPIAWAQALPAVSVEKLDTASAVNLSGRQRMLSQRMVKAYLMLGQDIAAERANAVLRDSIRLFETQLATLKRYQPTPQVQAAFGNVETEWKKFRPLIAATPSKAGAEDLYDANEALQKAAHSLTVAYENVSNAPLDHLVGIAGRQRMLSQRMAKFYFYRTWGLLDAPADMELHLARAHFTSMLLQIESSQLATSQTRSGVAKIRREWEPYQQVLFVTKDPAQMRKDAVRVAELSERVLTVTDELVALIAAQARGVAR